MANSQFTFTYELKEEGNVARIKISTPLNPEALLRRIIDQLETLSPSDQESVKQAILTGKTMEIRDAGKIKRILENIIPHRTFGYVAPPISLTFAKPKNASIQSHIHSSQNAETKTHTIQLQFEQRFRDPLIGVCLKHLIRPEYEVLLISDGGVEIEEGGNKMVIWKWDKIPSQTVMKVQYEIIQKPA